MHTPPVLQSGVNLAGALLELLGLLVYFRLLRPFPTLIQREVRASGAFPTCLARAQLVNAGARLMAYLATIFGTSYFILVLEGRRMVRSLTAADPGTPCHTYHAPGSGVEVVRRPSSPEVRKSGREHLEMLERDQLVISAKRSWEEFCAGAGSSTGY